MQHHAPVTPTVDTAVNESFGRAVALRRVRAGLTQEQMALAIGLSRTSIANIEGGRQQVLLHHAFAISRVLGASLDELVGRAEVPLEPRKAVVIEEMEDDLGAWTRSVLGAPNR
jgi:DNA-binding XRE family transcriptional regulator